MLPGQCRWAGASVAEMALRRSTMAVVTVVGLLLAALALPAGAATTIVRPGGGMWTVGPDGVVTPEPGTPWFGDARDLDLWEPIVGMAPTQSGNGYWLAARDSGVFSYGDAPFHGNLITELIARDDLPPGTLDGGNILDYLDGAIVDIASDGDGYYLLGEDGGVFTFGRLPFLGSGAGLLDTAAVAIRIVDGGYVITAADGSEWACTGTCVQATPPGVPVLTTSGVGPLTLGMSVGDALATGVLTERQDDWCTAEIDGSTTDFGYTVRGAGIDGSAVFGDGATITELSLRGSGTFAGSGLLIGVSTVDDVVAYAMGEGFDVMVGLFDVDDAAFVSDGGRSVFSALFTDRVLTALAVPGHTVCD